MVRMRVWWLLHGLAALGLSACAAASSDPTQAAPTQEPARASGSEGAAVFVIQGSESQARFVIGEILGGQPNTVIGVNDQVQGRVSLDAAAPSGSQIGAIEVAASGFVTDSGLRNRAINQFILETGAYPLITFVPTAIGGLPQAAGIGETVQLEITGDLTIRDMTQPVTFTAEVTLTAENRLEGSASATIQRADFELTIPQVPRVAGVDEAVILELDFVALAQ